MAAPASSRTTDSIDSTVPVGRVRALTDAPERADGRYVLYWMTAFRRARSNFALQHAVDACRRLGKPLIVLEALRVGYRWACDRFHAAIIRGMADNADAVRQAARAGKSVRYLPYIERAEGDGKGLLAALASPACLVVADDYPAFFLTRMRQAAADALGAGGVRVEAVDHNGILPVRATGDRVFRRAVDFRRFLQQTLPGHLLDFPLADPLAALPDGVTAARLPAGVGDRWPEATPRELRDPSEWLGRLPIDHSVETVDGFGGGTTCATSELNRFLRKKLDRYDEDGRHPDLEATSNLSPYLHFGHISSHDVFRDLFSRDGWTPHRLADDATGKREGWWGLSPAAESFLDELVTWRELGFNAATHDPVYNRYESVPQWARDSLEAHADDRREHVYDLNSFDGAETHDALWNAAQRQLRVEGRIHNYLRMLWGKKILEWSPTPETACEVMIELNNRYALDGRDPNSYSGILWVLGKYDRAWGPERPIFGTVRYMSSENTRRKLRLDRYLRLYGENCS